MQLDFHQVDAFSRQPFGGNPAIVYRLDAWLSDALMQQIAAEHNLSETAFLLPENDGYRLRWFTPKTEVPLCGHATLASAHVLWTEGFLDQGREARFHTKSGLLRVRKDGDWIRMDFPSRPASACPPPKDLEPSLGVPVLWVGHNGGQYLAQIDSERALRDLRPDFGRMGTFLGPELDGVIVTCRSEDPAYDFVSRFFAPALGIPEDPVTGVAHCCLGPFWKERLGKDAMTAYQASERGGVVQVRCDKDRVLLGGQAVTVMRCELQ